ncbi:MAG: c-type cytochrome [Caulobacterales bacterium]
MRQLFIALALALTPAAAFAQAKPAAPAAAAKPAIDGAKVFAQCRACHTIEKGGKNLVGPNLHGVIGRKAGALAGFNYSPAMKAYAQVWNDKTLDAYLAAPQQVVKGTRMTFVGVKNPDQRKAVIEYIKKAK